MEREIRWLSYRCFKICFTGVVITSFFKDFESSRPAVYGVGLLFSILVLMAGLVLSNKKKEE